MEKLNKLIHLILDKIKFLIISFLSREEKFRFIYKNQYWKNRKGGSLSGAGSNLSSTATLIGELNRFLETKNIKSLVDIPCGDWHWMSKVNLKTINYIGCDAIDEIIQENQNKHQTKNINFKKANIISDILPSADFIFIRDLFVHFKDSEILMSLENIKRYDFKYIGITNYPTTNLNKEKSLGDRWRPINLTINPFNLPNPDFLLSDTNNDNPMDKEKTLAIWGIESLLKIN